VEQHIFLDASEQADFSVGAQSISREAAILSNFILFAKTALELAT
jgi:hypothetical protein